MSNANTMAALVGVVAGAVCYLAFPAFIVANDIMVAMVIGGASGLSATGCNQIFKQLHKFMEHEVDDADKV